MLGEENNLKASILYTTTQALASAANKKALDAIAKIGLKEGWLFRTAEEARPVYTTAEQITKIPKLGKNDYRFNRSIHFSRTCSNV